ncbi:50S ribosomal protein L6 [Candidatus Hodarchaeum mangrovi]
MRHHSIERVIKVPEKVTVTLKPTRDGQEIHIEGPKGKLSRVFNRLQVNLTQEKNTLKVQNYFGSKNEASMVGTIAGHIQNMITGVTKGFTYKVQVITSHFPATVEVQKDVILIKNLYGRRDPIRVPADADVTTKVEGDLVIFTGIDKEKVAQAATRLAEATRLRGKRGKDPTVFQDGLYVVYP